MSGLLFRGSAHQIGLHGLPGNIALDIMVVLGTLFGVKWVLLQYDMLWTYAGPISLVASITAAGWRLTSNGETWAGLGLGEAHEPDPDAAMIGGGLRNYDGSRDRHRAR